MAGTRSLGATVLPVLMYHSVPASGQGNPLAVPRPLVDRQWRALRADGWSLRGLTEALALARTERNVRTIGVTFDDGYADFLGVLELLSVHDARATLYLPTSQPSPSGYLARQHDRSLSWAEVASLPRDLVEIGSHAHVHRPLDVLSQVDVEHEVRHSRRLLSERVGADAVSFCYPNGYSSQRVRQAVSAAGYANACIVGRRLADPDGDLYALPRLHVTPAHDEAAIVALVSSGESGLAPRVKRLARPAWRVVRQTVYRTTGRVLT
jgi:peptidoglycan/xylan/chitin deacetylase (PgdA/CDA1 family)